MTRNILRRWIGKNIKRSCLEDQNNMNEFRFEMEGLQKKQRTKGQYVNSNQEKMIQS